MRSERRAVGPRFAVSANLLIPALGLAAIMVVIAIRQPVAVSYFGASLLLAYGMPLIFASLAQTAIIAAGDVDLGIGPFISLVTCIAAAMLSTDPVMGTLALLAAVAGYGALGALIHIRQLPSIVATLGASFIWLGLAMTILPTPGGQAPDWIAAVAQYKPPVLPLPVIVAVLCALAADLFFNRLPIDVVLRGFGGNARAVARAGWSTLRARVTLYLAAGVCGVLAGLFMTGLNTTGDPNVGTQYTLQSVAAVIIGGGDFRGGRIVPVGSVIGALIMLLTGSLLSFADVSPNWQLSIQGLLLILVLGARRLSRRSALP